MLGRVLEYFGYTKKKQKRYVGRTAGTLNKDGMPLNVPEVLAENGADITVTALRRATAKRMSKRIYKRTFTQTLKRLRKGGCITLGDKVQITNKGKTRLENAHE